MSLSPAGSSTSIRRDPTNGMRSLAMPALAVVIGFIILVVINPVLAVVVLLIIIAVALLARWKSIVAALKWRSPHIEIETEYFDLGSRPVISYYRSSRRPTDVNACSFETLVKCTESVTYRQGSSSRTVERVVYEQQGVGEGVGTADGVEGELELDISAYYGAPSMGLPDNRIEWEVEISIVDDGMPNDSHRFDLQVAPRLDPQLRPGVQDS